MYIAKSFESLFGISGLSDQILKNHFTLYQGYVSNTNKLLDAMSKLDSSPEFAELHRRFGWEFNGMRLHELYFENISKDNVEFNKTSILGKSIVEQFGSFENFENDIKALASIRGIGWVVLTYDPIEKRLFNIWINEHDLGYLAGCIPLLIIDVFEQAYMLDYGLKKVDYINAIFKSIDWNVVEKRFNNF